MSASVENENVTDSGLPALLHELAEGLQSVGNYLSAAHRGARSGASAPPSHIEIIEKALYELSRSKTAFHELRAHLLDVASEPGEQASNEAPPMVWTPFLGGQ
jgi:hypothetical protein